ncbi:hypothetical protein CG435_05800 [Pantoea ananatis]|nr:hypothetical protein AW734_14085 [Pantoea ananatis]OWY78474.1 hypothetical protein CDN97_01595 [Pantoea sp. AMG 501]PQL03032.1 hypothetical protein CG435_05800 [Pantoea ananatis]CRH29328.1 Uncharacterized protein {ECO:0000313/EMBL:ERM14094.1} [Pantoea ananatis]
MTHRNSLHFYKGNAWIKRSAYLAIASANPPRFSHLLLPAMADLAQSSTFYWLLPQVVARAD